MDTVPRDMRSEFPATHQRAFLGRRRRQCRRVGNDPRQFERRLHAHLLVDPRSKRATVRWLTPNTRVMRLFGVPSMIISRTRCSCAVSDSSRRRTSARLAMISRHSPLISSPQRTASANSSARKGIEITVKAPFFMARTAIVTSAAVTQKNDRQNSCLGQQAPPVTQVRSCH